MDFSFNSTLFRQYTLLELTMLKVAENDFMALIMVYFVKILCDLEKNVFSAFVG